LNGAAWRSRRILGVRLVKGLLSAALCALLPSFAPPAAAQLDGLRDAARLGDLERVAALLAEGADPNAYRDSYSPLMSAAGSGHAEVVALLLQYGAEVEYRDRNGDRALLRAAQNGHAEAVRLLLEAGAAPDSDDDPHSITPLMAASRYGHAAAARLLLAAGADPRRLDQSDASALHNAALAGSTALVVLLLAAGAEPNPPGAAPYTTPLHYAVDDDRPEIAFLLIEAGADLEARNSDGETALFRAAAFNRPTILAALLAAGADPDARDDAGRTPFLAAALPLARGAIDPEAAEAGAAARLLVERTADLDRAFAAALWGGLPDLARRLLTRGAAVDAVDEFGRSALAAAVLLPGIDTLEWLLAEGAAIERHGATALREAAAAGRLDALELLLAAGVPADARDEAGATALLHAAGEGQVEAVRLLLGSGADGQAVDAAGRNAADYMQLATGWFALQIATREASRAWRPTDLLREQVEALRQRQAAILDLLAE